MTDPVRQLVLPGRPAASMTALRVPTATLDRLRTAAVLRGKAPADIARALLETAGADDLVDAILDDRKGP